MTTNAYDYLLLGLFKHDPKTPVENLSMEKDDRGVVIRFREQCPDNSVIELIAGAPNEKAEDQEYQKTVYYPSGNVHYTCGYQHNKNKGAFREYYDMPDNILKREGVLADNVDKNLPDTKEIEKFIGRVSTYSKKRDEKTGKPIRIFHGSYDAEKNVTKLFGFDPDTGKCIGSLIQKKVKGTAFPLRWETEVNDDGTIHQKRTGGNRVAFDRVYSPGHQTLTDSRNNIYTLKAGPGQEITYAYIPTPCYSIKSPFVYKTNTEGEAIYISNDTNGWVFKKTPGGYELRNPSTLRYGSTPETASFNADGLALSYTSGTHHYTWNDENGNVEVVTKPDKESRSYMQRTYDQNGEMTTEKHMLGGKYNVAATLYYLFNKNARDSLSTIDTHRRTIEEVGEEWNIAPKQGLSTFNSAINSLPPRFRPKTLFPVAKQNADTPKPE